ncbi:murein biosynthesis integral membrane protein MurJ [Alcanivorax sp. DG881]|jgi:putative peptidoglycan lipid II flippase|uniref:murein biosynthesis integral membrane protein MurJ n=1 Tax=Alcanivorax sp. DG881 TaxID=236097 RepID=UPI00017EBDD8|nr:murein biosynthesis integral membrane protein MurJ [Alcanivorax sp. DG881]EDX88478.1 integral membrane protein MviN [Alcanivorax sp. DG881]
MTDTPEQPPKKAGLLASTAVVATMTMLSRVLGLVRDVVIARMLGASAGADAFFVALKIPNFLRRLFAEGAFNQAFVPVLSEYRSSGSMAATKLLVDRVAGTLGGTLVLVTLVGVLAAPAIIWVFAPGFGDDPVKRALTVEMLRLTFPYLFFIALTAFAGGILNSWNRFAVPAFTPVLLNLSLIGCALFLAPHFAEDRMAVALAWGVLIAGVVQLLFQLPFLARLNLMPIPRMGWRDPGVRKIMKLMAPALFGASVYQLNSLVNTILASMLETGSVTWLYYTDRLIELPLGIFAVAIGTVILPSLSSKHADASPEAFSRTLDWAIRMVLLIGLPAALALFALAEPLLSTLFQYGEFSAFDVTQTAASLRAYSAGLLAAMLIKVLAPGFYARQDTRTPVRIGVLAMLANMLLGALLVWEWRHVGLASAMALSAWLNAGLLYLGLRRSGVYQPLSGWALQWLRMLLAGAAMVVACYWLSLQTTVWNEAGVWLRVGWLSLIVAAGVVIYLSSLVVLGLRVRHLRR